MKRFDRPTSTKPENYEHVLMCLICRSLFDDHDHQPKFLPCHHTFCKECLREYVRQTGDEIECPSCRKIATIPAAGVAALQTNFYAKYIQSLVYGCGSNSPGLVSECPRHPNDKLVYFCDGCSLSLCEVCLRHDNNNDCKHDKRLALTAVIDKHNQDIDMSFSSASTLIEGKKVELEGLLKALSLEKDSALIKIESTFEKNLHMLTRRATLLKNKVIDLYNEHVTNIDADVEEVSTAMTCVVSLKEYHEMKIGRGDFTDIVKGIEELKEVERNVSERIKPNRNHILFDDQHGTDRFRSCVKDLGRIFSKPSVVLDAKKKAENQTEESDSPSYIVSDNKEHSSLTDPPSGPKMFTSFPSSSIENNVFSNTLESEVSVDKEDKMKEIVKNKNHSFQVSSVDIFLQNNMISDLNSSFRDDVDEDVMFQTDDCENNLNDNDDELIRSLHNIMSDLNRMTSCDDDDDDNAVLRHDHVMITTDATISDNNPVAMHNSCPRAACDCDGHQSATCDCDGHTGTVCDVASKYSHSPTISECEASRKMRYSSDNQPNHDNQTCDAAMTTNEVNPTYRHIPHNNVMSYDESRFRLELGYETSDVEDGIATSSKQMSRSDFWLMMNSSIESNVSESNENLMIAELSGEQTSL